MRRHALFLNVESKSIHNVKIVLVVMFYIINVGIVF